LTTSVLVSPCGLSTISHPSRARPRSLRWRIFFPKRRRYFARRKGRQEAESGGESKPCHGRVVPQFEFRSQHRAAAFSLELVSAPPEALAWPDPAVLRSAYAGQARTAVLHQHSARSTPWGLVKLKGDPCQRGALCVSEFV
jgi:hypothetical protein